MIQQGSLVRILGGGWGWCDNAFAFAFFALRAGFFLFFFLIYLFHIRYDFGADAFGDAHDAEDLTPVGGGIGVDHYYGCINGQFEFGDLCPQQGIEQNRINSFGTDVELLGVIDRYSNMLLGLGILGAPRIVDLYNVGIGNGGNDQEEEQEDEQDVIQGSCM